MADMNRREFNKAMPLLTVAAFVTPAGILTSEAAAAGSAPASIGGGRTIYWIATMGQDSFEGKMTVPEETYDRLIHHSEDLCSGDVHEILAEAIDNSEPIRSDPSIEMMSFGVSTRPI